MNVKAHLLSANADPAFVEINITPFTDVLLVLLVIFMVLAALVAPAGFEKEAPTHCMDVCTAHHRELPPIDVTISRRGTIEVNGSIVSVPRLYAALATVARKHRSTLRLTADAKAPYGLVLRALDAAKESNLEPVTLVTQ